MGAHAERLALQEKGYRGQRHSGEAVDSPFQRSAGPETPHIIAVSGGMAVEFPRKFPKCLPVLSEQSALIGGTGRLFCVNLRSFCDKK